MERIASSGSGSGSGSGSSSRTTGASLLTFACGPAAALVLVWLSHANFISDTPLWILFGLLGAAGVVNFAVLLGLRTASPQLRVQLRSAASIGSTAPFLYATGWGSLVVIGYALGVADVMRTEGSRAWRAGFVWSALCIVAGELAIEIGAAPTVVSVGAGHAIAALSGVVLGVVLLTLGTTTRNEEVARARLARERATFHDLVEHAADVIALTDHDGILEYVSPGIASVLGVTSEECTGRDIGVLMDAADRIGFEDLCRGLAALDPVAAEFRFMHRDGTSRAIRTTITARTDGARIVNLHDITLQRDLEDQMRRRATEDSLTKLPNRHAIMDRLELILQDGRPTVLFIDLDGFKEVNDAFGHERGDEVLVEAAQRIARCLPAGTSVGRLGGDEFLVFNADGNVVAAHRIAAVILDALSQPWPDLGGLPIGASIGVAHMQPTETVDDLIRRADNAMYRAKAGDGGRIVAADTSGS